MMARKFFIVLVIVFLQSVGTDMQVRGRGRGVRQGTGADVTYCYYWETCMMARKFFIVLVIVFLRTVGTDMQGGRL